jgi:hypothetical protein
MRSSSELSGIQAQLNRAHDREVQAWQQVADLHGRLAVLQGRLAELHARLESIEGHPVLGPALRGRRRLRRILHEVVNGPSAG